MGRYAYTPEQNAWIAERFPTMTNRELAAAFDEEFGEAVTVSAMNSWGHNHHMRKEPWVRGKAGRRYTDEQLDFLREVIPGRSLSEVNELYEERFGTRLTRSALCNLRTKLGVYCGVNAGRFRKGHVPANKGRTWDEFGTPEGHARSRATQFAKGNHPPNEGERLDERLNNDTWQVKVDCRDAKNPIGYWVSRARFNWERENGMQWPDGCKAIHIDGDSMNDDADNIEPVPADLWPLVMGAVPGQMEWHDRETLRTAILYTRVTRARVDSERRARIAAGRPRKDDLSHTRNETE